MFPINYYYFYRSKKSIEAKLNLVTSSMEDIREAELTETKNPLGEHSSDIISATAVAAAFARFEARTETDNEADS